MEQAEDKKMIAEMNDFLADKAKANKSADDPKAEENLPFESIDSYSTDPVGFGEMSLRMLNKVEFVFDLAAKENRFSSKYLKRCTQLEKGIKYLGSLCVTKYALQTKGQTFPQLGQLSTEKLYCMTSHHFRKLDMAVTEYMFEHRDVPDKLFDMEMRYFNLLERLRSTEVKIEKFHDRYIFGPEDYSPIIHGMAFSGKNKSRSIHEKHDEAPAFRHAPAFGLLADASGLNRKSEIRNKNLSSSNEEGRMKKEEQVSGVSGQGSEVTVAPDQGGEAPVPNPIGRSPYITGQVPCRRGLTPSVTGVSETVPLDQLSPAPSEGTVESPVSPLENAAENTKSEIRNQREQLSKAGTTRKVAEKLHKNEEGRMKNEERIEDQGARIEQPEAHGDCHPAVAKPAQGTVTSDAPLPPCLEIMKRVMERSRESDDGSLTFMIDEMEFLAADPLFARLDPRLAADLRKILKEKPPD